MNRLRIDSEPAFLERLPCGRATGSGEIVSLVDPMPIIGIDSATWEDPHSAKGNLRVAFEHQRLEAFGSIA